MGSEIFDPSTATKKTVVSRDYSRKLGHACDFSEKRAKQKGKKIWAKMYKI